MISLNSLFHAGCASGFGFSAAVELNRRGYYVLAGCRETNDSRAKKLVASVKNPRRFKVIKLDVTSADDIRSAHETVNKLIEEREEGVTQLYAVVNNAGFSLAHLNEAGDPYDDEIYQKHMDINYLAPIRLTRVMLPLIRRAKGRIVMIGSQSARTSALFISPYAASKAALAKLSECLRLEVKPFGVKVIDIEPSFFKTAMMNVPKLKKDIEDNVASSSDEVKTAYKENCKLPEAIRMIMRSLSDETVVLSDLTIVIDTMVDALESYEPDFVYPVCPPVLGFLVKMSDPIAWELKTTTMYYWPSMVDFVNDCRDWFNKVPAVDVHENNNDKKK